MAVNPRARLDRANARHITCYPWHECERRASGLRGVTEEICAARRKNAAAARAVQVIARGRGEAGVGTGCREQGTASRFFIGVQFWRVMVRAWQGP